MLYSEHSFPFLQKFIMYYFFGGGVINIGVVDTGTVESINIIRGTGTRYLREGFLLGGGSV